MSEPDASGRIEVSAAPEAVYDLVSDLGRLADLAEEYAGHRWVGPTRGAVVGARFRGHNRRGLRRWSTLSTITDADPGRRFGFEVTSIGVPVARWQYDFEAAGDGCVVVESMWERRPAWFRVPSSTVTGVWNRREANTANIAATLARLKTAVEASR
ncbi:SRPBCC family protein [Amycolatopsis sp., V23-08]|uniref:SRPBCC family protein n=1 Tax=Amycolatopsis heterodermiae TaxID=3110235 RepID=A0ABU5R0I8_9PSEU|nr:SRPBCC family protein [Amycolatopsis sp., V23-08]MEA5359681.1 SRPBCC family protein [Amycolatopsis sp., V23-08]